MGIQKTLINVDELDIDSITEEMIAEVDNEAIAAKIGKKSPDYVNNKELYAEYVRYDIMCKEAEAKGLPRPQLTHKIALACMQICDRVSNSFRFRSYSEDWKEEMVGDAKEHCAAGAHKFDINESQNPFAYITTIVYNAFFNRLNIEGKHHYTILKSYDESHGYGAEEDTAGNDSDDVEGVSELNEMYSNRLTKIAEYEERFGLNKERKKYEHKNQKRIIKLDL